MTDLDHSTRYELMTSDQVPADELAAWMKEPGFAAYVEGRNASMAARQAGVNAPALSDAHALIERCAQHLETIAARDSNGHRADYFRAAAADIRSFASTIPAAEPEPAAWLTTWHRDGEEWVNAHANEVTALDEITRHKGTITPLYASPQPARETDEQKLSGEILAELTRARTKFPGKNVTFAALVEEVGELATATFEESRGRVRKEAVQVAVMAMRMVLDGDHTFDDWRASKGLDALTNVAALRARCQP